MKYEQPNMEILKLDIEVITTSSLSSNTAGTDNGYDAEKDLGW